MLQQGITQVLSLINNDVGVRPKAVIIFLIEVLLKGRDYLINGDILPAKDFLPQGAYIVKGDVFLMRVGLA